MTAEDANAPTVRCGYLYLNHALIAPGQLPPITNLINYNIKNTMDYPQLLNVIQLFLSNLKNRLNLLKPSRCSNNFTYLTVLNFNLLKALIDHKIYVLLPISNLDKFMLIIQAIISLAILQGKYIHHIKVKKQDHFMD